VLYHPTLPFYTCRAFGAITITTLVSTILRVRLSAHTSSALDQRLVLQFERVNEEQIWSGRRDSNPRPLEPHSSALPSCATARRQRSAKMRCDRGFFKQEKHCTPKRLPSGPDLGAPEVRPSAEPGCKHGPWSPYFTGVGRPRNAPFTSSSSFEATDPAPRLTL
jgi:hypothetical protein